MSVTSIEWTDRTWNPVRGCSRVSEGCDNCYAMHQARRFWQPGQSYAGLTRYAERRGVDWTGVVRLVPDQLDTPLRWRKPQKIFVNSMSDLFHEALSGDAIAAVFGIMACSPQHTFQILTKRPDRMRQWSLGMQEHHRMHMSRALAAAPVTYPRALEVPAGWPLPNVWLGVSVEDKATADERIPLLLRTPAAVRFVSYEPALGPVDFLRWLQPLVDSSVERTPRLDQIIVGGESGPGARPFNVAWVRSVVRQCRPVGCAAFCKQLGARPFDGYLSPVELVGSGKGRPRPVGQPLTEAMATEALSALPVAKAVPRFLQLRDRKGGDMAEWPEDLRVREFPA